MFYQIICRGCNNSFVAKRYITTSCSRKCAGLSRRGVPNGYSKADFAVIKSDFPQIFYISYGLLRGDESVDLKKENLLKVRNHKFLKLNFPYLCR